MTGWVLALMLGAAPEAVLLERVVAVANDRGITASAVATRAASDYGSFDGGAAEPAALLALIDEALIAAEAEHLGISVDEREIDAAIAEISSRDGVQAGDLDLALAALRMSMAEYRERLGIQLRELKWLQLYGDRSRKPKDEAGYVAWITAEKARLLGALRARAVIELRDGAAFEATGAGDAGCPARLPERLAVFDGGLTGRNVQRACVLGAPAEVYEALASALKAHEGKPLAPGATRQVVEALISTGTLRDARAVALPAGPAVVLVYALDPYPPIVAATVSGNRQRPAAELTHDIPLGARVSGLRVRRFVDELTQAYRDHGFPDAGLDFRLEPADGGVRLHLEVREGERATVAALRFKGNKVLTTAALQAAVHSRVGGPYSPSVLTRDIAAMSSLFSEHGLLDGRVLEPKVKPAPGKPGAVELTYGVKEGPVHRIRKVSFKGWTKGRADELLSKLELRAGQPFSRGSLRGDLDRIAHQAHELGTEVTVTPAVDFDAKAKAVDLTWELVRKPRTGIEF